MNEGVSVIICCYNSEATIGQVLEHIQCQKNTDGFKWEVIVVDNASSDQTERTAKEAWTREDIELRVVYEGEAGLSNARKKGLEVASYSIIVFVDDDNLLHENYISTGFHVMTSHPDVGLAGGLGTPLASRVLPAWFKEYESAFAVGAQAPEMGYLPAARTYLHGAGVVMRKSVWDKLISCGFEFLLSGRKGKSLSSGEDSELTSAFRLAGCKLWYDPGMRFAHIIPDQRLRWDYIVRLAREFGKAGVVIDLYSVRINNARGWSRIKMQVWLMGMAVSFVNLIRVFPGYMRILTRYSEGRRKEFEFSYHYGYFIQKLRLLGRHAMVKNEISRLQRSLTR
jgi:glycosyltransferase involved in cell wall biosynthesis